MASVRWRKLRGDLRAAWGRIVVVQLAIALALAGVGTVLGARAVLSHEIVASYLSTNPAEATLVLADNIDPALLAAVRARPEVADADRRQMVHTRVRLRPEDPWQMLVLFVADDFSALRLNTFRPETGAWPPPRGSILLERTAPAVMGIAMPAGGGHHMHDGGHMPGGHMAMFAQLLGARATLQTPHGVPTEVAITGTVHDAGQAPNWQEHRGVAYTTAETLAMLGEPAELHELLVRFRPTPATMADAERDATQLAESLRAQGHEVHEIRVPKLRQHPHQLLMNAVQLVLLAFSFLLLVLAAIVLATLLSSILARQTREVGVMKAIGATSGQLAVLYAAFVLALGLVAVAIALPVAHVGASGMISGVARMMNLAVTDPVVPLWVYVAIALVGMLVPLAIAAVPIARATRLTVRESLAHTGATGFVRAGATRLPLAIRNALRRPGRLALTLVLLVVGGALVIAAANLQAGLRRIASKVEVARHYDLEIRLHEPVGDDVVTALRAVPGVRTVEAWTMMPGALARDGQLDVVHTYPDGGHGSFALMAPPATGSTLVDFPVTSGRWLAPGDTDAVVLGHGAARGARVGERVTIDVEGRRSTWTVVGIAEEIGGGSAFVMPQAFRAATGITGTRLIRVATTARNASERTPILAGLEAALAARGARVEYAIPLPLLRTIIDDHVRLVVNAVIIIAALLALVGLIGLGSAMAVNVAERTREIGIMKAIGAGDGRVMRILLGEAMFVGAVSAILAIAVALPVTMLVTARIAANGFIAAPPFTLSVLAVLGWPVAMIAGSALACLLPARRAARLPVRVALSEL